MDDLNAPKINKWPFFIGDLVMVVFASAILVKGPWPLSVTLTALCGVLLLAGGVLSIIPYILEYQAAMRLAESDKLNQTVARINQLDTLASQITSASGHWQTAQELAEKTTRTAREITNRMEAETKAFEEFMRKTQDAEKSRLQLEIDKLHRAEGEWVQTTTAMLDHIFALFVAGMRSGQPNLIEQLGQFQNACRDLAHRMGLTAFMPKPNDPFSSQAHQLMDSQAEVPAGSVIAQIVATGYTYQGQLIRRAVVTVKNPQADEAAATTTTTSSAVPPEGAMPSVEAEPEIDSDVVSSEEEEKEEVAEELPETAPVEIAETESESLENAEPETASVDTIVAANEEQDAVQDEAPEKAEIPVEPETQVESAVAPGPEPEPEPEPSVAEEPESESAKPSHPPRPPREQELF